MFSQLLLKEDFPCLPVEERSGQGGNLNLKSGRAIPVLNFYHFFFLTVYLY